MPRILVALVWAALLIGLPLFGRTGLIAPATLSGMAPTLSVLAVLHVSTLRRGRSCLRGRPSDAMR